MYVEPNWRTTCNQLRGFDGWVLGHKNELSLLPCRFLKCELQMESGALSLVLPGNLRTTLPNYLDEERR